MVAVNNAYAEQDIQALYDLAGEFTWIVLYGGLGYAFGSQWEAINQFISDFSGLLVGLVLFGVGLYLLVRRRRQSRLANQEMSTETGEAA